MKKDDQVAFVLRYHSSNKILLYTDDSTSSS